MVGDADIAKYSPGQVLVCHVLAFLVAAAFAVSDKKAAIGRFLYEIGLQPLFQNGQ